MSANNFRRSNVNAKTLQITDPARSSFDLGHKNDLSIPFGRLIPVSHRILIATDTFQGSISPNFHLEKIATPSIGPVRLDTHTFVVNFRRLNRDMRKNMENSVNFFPAFTLYDVVSNFFACLVWHSSILRTGSVGYSSLGNLWATYMVRRRAQQPSLVINTLILWAREIILHSIWSGISGWLAAASEEGNIFGTIYYQLDKLHYLETYYKELYQNFDTYINADSTITNKNNDPRIIFEYLVPMILKPIAGPSTLFDYLGYPVYTQYSAPARWYYRPTSDSMGSNPDGLVSRFSDVQCNQWAAAWLKIDESVTPYRWNLPYCAFSAAVFDLRGTDSLLQLPITMRVSFSEMPLRAYYAAWYDHLRNWHVEERRNVLDPDDFSNASVFGLNPVTGSTSLEIFSWLARFLSFATLQYRDYNTDFLTSIQTDDVFRHVFSPVFAAGTETSFPSGGSVAQVSPNDPPSPELSMLLGFGDIDSPSVSAFLPGDSSASGFDMTDFVSVAYQDLQVMRRANMLERWLARNYYYPDTYVGRLQARFGVRPSDYEVLVSNYIGGSEQFIQGSELVANMSTSETVVGSRNLKADVSLKDTFSGSVSDYSCLISFVSTVPVVSYDVLHPSVSTIDFVDFAAPEFATDTRVEARTSDFLRGFPIKPFIGYVPRYYMFRTAADETHGRYLTDYRAYNWFRDWLSMGISGNEFSLTPYSLRVHLPLDAFIGLTEWDDFAYGDCDCRLAINRPLPAAIEVI